MPAFGPRSLGLLATVDYDLVRICRRTILVSDFAVICGARGKDAQEEAYRTGNSNARWPESKHNAIPPGLSLAVDLAPWHKGKPHIRWENEREFVFLAGQMAQAAHELGVRIRWGGDWDRDNDLYDINKPFDLGHYEIDEGG